MSDRIEWSDTETRNYRCWLRVVRCWEVTPGRIEGQVEGQATVEDLRRACEAAGLTLATAQHAEDLAKLGREMSEVVAQPLQARLDVARRVERDVRTALCASMSECTDVAARRVAGERDLARAERDKYFQACENWRKLDAPLSEFRRVLRVGDYESTLDAARRMSRELEVCLGQLDHVMAREKSGQLEAYALGRKSAEEQEAEWESERKELVAQRDDAMGTANEVATLRDRVDGLEIDLNSAVQNAKAIEVEANNLRSANRTLRARVAELEAIAREAESQANGMVSQRIAALGVAVNGAADEEAVSPDVQVVRGDFVMTKFRERLARIEAASPATQGQPVATDEELCTIGERAFMGAYSGSTVARYAAYKAVARHVRAERPACLVARAVALNVDVRVAEDVTGFLVATLDSPGVDEAIERAVPAADVPATLARLLDEVEAARKAVAK